MRNLSSEEILMLSAKSDVADVVEVCMKILQSYVDKNNWDIDWFVDEFRTQFNRKLNELQN